MIHAVAAAAAAMKAAAAIIFPHHRISRNQAELVDNEVGGWHVLIVFSNELEVPARVQQPIAELLLF